MLQLVQQLLMAVRSQLSPQWLTDGNTYIKPSSFKMAIFWWPLRQHHIYLCSFPCGVHCGPCTVGVEGVWCSVVCICKRKNNCIHNHNASHCLRLFFYTYIASHCAHILNHTASHCLRLFFYTYIASHCAHILNHTASHCLRLLCFHLHCVTLRSYSQPHCVTLSQAIVFPLTLRHTAPIEAEPN